MVGVKAHQTAIVNQKGGVGKTTTALNLDLIPCSLELSGIEMGLVNVMSRELILKSIVEEIEKDYDYVLIDCSPSLGMLTINALAACDSIIIPVNPEYLSAKGLALLVNNINRIKKRLNPNIEIDGILITMIDERTNLSKNILKVLNQSIELIRDNFNLNYSQQFNNILSVACIHYGLPL